MNRRGHRGPYRRRHASIAMEAAAIAAGVDGDRASLVVRGGGRLVRVVVHWTDDLIVGLCDGDSFYGHCIGELRVLLGQRHGKIRLSARRFGVVRLLLL